MNGHQSFQGLIPMICIPGLSTPQLAYGEMGISVKLYKRQLQWWRTGCARRLTSIKAALRLLLLLHSPLLTPLQTPHG